MATYDGGERWTWKEDGYTVVRSNARTAPGCHDNCGVLVYVKDGKVAKVEGDPDNPYNQGRLCNRCLALKDFMYSDKRLLHPMKRAKEDRGKDKWEQITWDEAYDIIESEFRRVSAQYGPESIIVSQGTGRDIYHMSRMAYAIGTPNWTPAFHTGNPCYLPRMAALGAVMGSMVIADCSQYFPDRYDNPNYVVPELMMIWGTNPLVSNPDGFFGHWVTDLMQRGTSLIVVDPKLTWAGARAEMWLKIKPGTDCALALGMLHVMITEDLYDEEFVDEWCYGFGELAQRIAEYTPEWASEITWIPEEEIIQAARRYATAKPACIEWGLALDQQMGGVDCAHAMVALWALSGNLDRPGGNVISMPIGGLAQSNWSGGWGYDDILTEEQRNKRLGTHKYPLLNFGFLIGHPDTIIEAMETGKDELGNDYPVKAIWIQSQNALSCMGTDPKQTLRLLQGMEFVAAADVFMTPTILAVADVVLPVAMWPEKGGLGGMCHYLLTPQVKAVEPLGECKSDQQINYDLGKRFNPGAYPWDTVEDGVSVELEPLGMTYEDLAHKGWYMEDFQYEKYAKGLIRPDGQPGFNTMTTKIELFSPAYQAWGYDPLPRWIPPLIEPSEEYPYVFTSGARVAEFFHSEGRQIERLRMNHPEPLMYLHPDTAKKEGIAEGDWVYMENNLGRFKMRAKFDETYDPRVIASDHGWWFPERDASDGTLYGTFESNANMLIPNICGEKGWGGNQKSSACKIYKAID